MRWLRVLAINQRWFDELYFSIPLGLATIVSIVQKCGHNVDVINLDTERELSLQKNLEHFNAVPDIVLLTGMITSFNVLRQISSVTRKFYPDCLIVLGGGLASTAPNAILKKLEVDVFVQNEGDEIIKHLLDAYMQDAPLKKIRGLKLKDIRGNIY